VQHGTSSTNVGTVAVSKPTGVKRVVKELVAFKSRDWEK
jgi:hypothetical protein